MGLPLEQWRGAEADGGSEKEASGCRTPSNSLQARAATEGAGGDCPNAPRKRRAAAGAVSQQHRDYYTGADVEAFFAGHNL